MPWSSFWCSLGGPGRDTCHIQTVWKIFKIHNFLYYFEQPGLPESYLEGHRNGLGARSDAQSITKDTREVFGRPQEATGNPQSTFWDPQKLLKGPPETTRVRPEGADAVLVSQKL